MDGCWTWRSMRTGDLARVVALADVLFPDHPEEATHFAARLERGGELCLALVDAQGAVCGYAVAYPWPLGDIPPLNRSAAPPTEPGDAIYLHDLGIRPDLSGTGRARAGLAALLERARAARATTVALVAVNGSAGFWRARGFAARDPEGAMAAKLARYGTQARYMVLRL